MTTDPASTSYLRHRRPSPATKISSKIALTTTVSEEVIFQDDTYTAVDNNQHDDGYTLTPLIQRSTITRLDVGPFLIAYLGLIWWDLQQRQLHQDEDPQNSVHILLQPTTLVFATVLLAHLAVVLRQQWNVHFRSVVGYQKAPLQISITGKGSNAENTALAVISSWTHCLVQEASPPTLQGAGKRSNDKTSSTVAAAGIAPVELCTVHKEKYKVAVVKFHDIYFRCATIPRSQDLDLALWTKQPSSTHSSLKDGRTTISFYKVQFPIGLPFSFYQHWKGHSSVDSVLQCQQLYGTNATVLELPSFLELLSEQVVAPFFLFQIFCVVLWCLDEYWYYSLFTLAALLCFESTVAYNRLQGLQRLRNSSRQNTHRLWVHRKSSLSSSSKTTKPSTWIQITAQELVPGDLVSLTAQAGGGSDPKARHHNSVPADVLVLQGNAVVDEALLTGESIPQLKVPFDATTSNSNNGTSSTTMESQFDMQEHKDSVLFGGTVLLTCRNGDIDDDNYGANSSSASDEDDALKSPDNGVVGIVLRTGFETAQGNLLRTIAHSSKSVDGVHTTDTFVFIFLLVCCAVASANIVLQDGWEDETRNRFRLVLHVVIIITSVIPPELPMELSLAVTNSVADLMKRFQVYCTEHFRIPLAGLVDVCCFDKTGTLTSDEMLLKGVRLFLDDDLEYLKEEDALVNPADASSDGLPWPVTRVMAACHSLALGGPGLSGPSIIGDPLEQAVLKDTGYRMAGNNVLMPMHQSEGQPQKIFILVRFAFSSRLKRMTVLAVEDSEVDRKSGKVNGNVWALTKGAPETVKSLLAPKSIPSDYDKVSMYHMSRGRRVLAMAYRSLGPNRTVQSLKEDGRDAIEFDLTFAGFLILECPLKPDSKSVISEMQSSDHRVVMITGDAVLTAAEVARQVGIIPISGSGSLSRVYKLQERSGSASYTDVLSAFEFVPLSMAEDNISDGDTPDKVLALSGNMKTLQNMAISMEASFCMTGDVLTKVAAAAIGRDSSGPIDAFSSTVNEKILLLHPHAQSVLKEICTLVSVFARHAPHQKEAVVAAFNLSGHHTLMCGDGTNDCGALKRAHVGISIVSAPEAESKQRKAAASLTQAKAEEKRERKAQKKGKGKKSGDGLARRRSVEDSLRLLREAQEEIEQVELGDASVASPFTSRQVSISCCKNVLQQGRCTLVTMLQIYKILGVNCLVNAMVLSTLFLHGAKQGDRQLTVLGMAVAALFLFVTRAKPLRTLSKVRPPSSVMCPHALLSIALQFIIHFGAIMMATKAALIFVDPYDPSIIPDGPFNPNVLNTCTFMLTVLATVNTFGVNYRGRPFMEDLRENTYLWRCLLACYGALFMCAFEVFPPLNDLLQLSPFPPTNVTLHYVPGDDATNDLLADIVRALDFPTYMCLLMALDTGLSFIVEKTIIKTFEG